MIRRSFRLTPLVAACAVMSLLLASCRDEEGEARKRLAGTYTREIDARPKTDFYARQDLTVTLDGRWLRTTRIEARGMPQDSPPDSGTYRIQGVTVLLRSLVEPGGVPYKFTIAGDTLFSANATTVHAITGYDIGEETYVRTR